jgi:transcriptional regulator with GAF, ATPase, and Fis domain/tetratricopeptide (TPR) repeat protein
MKKTLPELSAAQWEFLAVLEALGGSAHIDVLDALAMLSAGQLIGLLKKAGDAGLLVQDSREVFSLCESLPAAAMEKIRAINTEKTLSALVDLIREKKIERDLDPQALINLLERSGRAMEASMLEFERADAGPGDGSDLDEVHRSLMRAVGRLKDLPLDHDAGALFIAHTLKLAKLCYMLGRGINELEGILKKAAELAKGLGDKRSQALIMLYMGMLYFIIGRRDDAYDTLSKGLERVNELGDEDILAQSAEFLGLLYFMKGLSREALKSLEHLETSMGISEVETQTFVYLVFGYSALYLGQLHRAFGFLDSNLRLAEEKNNKRIASVLRAILGVTLVLVKRYHEAEVTLVRARQDSVESSNAFGYHYSGGGLAYLYYMKGDMEKSYEIMKETVEKATQSGLVHQFSSPWILEIIYAYHQAGFEPLRFWNYHDISEAALTGINVHLKGVALRLHAQELLDQGSTEREPIMADLLASTECLELSGNYIELSKTVLQMARLELATGSKDAARRYGQEAWHLLGVHAADYFPSQYRCLLERKMLSRSTEAARGEYLRQYFQELKFIRSGMSQDDILNKTVVSTNRIFGAERGGIFWFPEGRDAGRPELRAASNLTKEEVDSPLFKPMMEHVLAAFKTNKPMVIRKEHTGQAARHEKMRSVLCIPFEVQGVPRGVLYHDTSYLKDAFDFLDPMLVTLLGRHTSDMIDFLLNTMRDREQSDKLSTERVATQQKLGKFELIAASRAMEELLTMAGQGAFTDTTVLLTGETGTGKGMLAWWIHDNSRRAEGPFITVDCTTIPENLVESELFGYEKGAFTGADKQKLGRVELANNGTLFLDEIGELPLGLQAKLLRALEEKTFVRIGGGRPIRSDFRLIAATNRDLKAEVAAGRFREDLFYRLNVFPLSIPPLRERKEDIAELAAYFLDYYARKYGRPGLELSQKHRQMLSGYAWPGNVRELQNIIERAIILSAGDTLEMPPIQSGPTSGPKGAFDDFPSLDDLQSRYIRHVLEHTKGRVGGPGGAAEILGMKRTSLYARMRSLGMRK